MKEIKEPISNEETKFLDGKISITSLSLKQLILDLDDSNWRTKKMFTLNNTFLRRKRLFENEKYICGEKKKNNEDQYDIDSMDSNTDFDSLCVKKFFFLDKCQMSKKKK